MIYRILVLGIAVAFTSGAAHADYFDGKQQLLCTAFQTHQCDSAGGCGSVSEDDVGAARHYLLNFKDKVVKTSRQDELESRIESKEIHDGTLFVQGIEDGRPDVRDGAAWSISINSPDGMMVLTVSAGDAAFVALGACTPYDG